MIPLLASFGRRRIESIGLDYALGFVRDAIFDVAIVVHHAGEIRDVRTRLDLETLAQGFQFLQRDHASNLILQIRGE